MSNKNLTKGEKKASGFTDLGIGAASAIVGLVVVLFPKVGFLLLLLMVAATLMISGVEILLVGIRGKKIRV